MAASFAAYASQYLARAGAGGGEQSLSSSSQQPMFYSFSTENGSRHALGLDPEDLDDMDDPHLRGSESLSHPRPQPQPQQQQRDEEEEEEDEDPYLRLDEEAPGSSFAGRNRAGQSIPLIRSPESMLSSRGDSPKGWLAHLAGSPSPLHFGRGRANQRDPSPDSSSSQLSTSSSPPPEVFGPSPARGKPPPRGRDRDVERNQPQSLSLTESLLPRDGHTRPLDVFSLPDHRHSRKRLKHHDTPFLSLFLLLLTICLILCPILLITTHAPKKIPKLILPYTTLLHTVPLLTILTFVSAGVAYAHVWLLRIAIGPVMIVTEVGVPLTLFGSAVWAFAGSFMWEEGEEPTWGETVGLRLFALIPLILSIFSARRLLNLPRRVHMASGTLTLTTQLLATYQPYILLLSPLLLLISLLLSIPFVTILFRLLLVGYKYGTPPKTEWKLHQWADWAIVGVVGVWLWSWGVARGVLRVTAAGVVASWYFADEHAPPPLITSTHIIMNAITRSTGPSLGTIALSSLILTLLRLLTLLTLLIQRIPIVLKRLSPYAPFLLRLLPVAITGVRWIVGYIEGVTDAMSAYALVYVGITGDRFWDAARRSRVLVRGVEEERGRRVKREAPISLLTIAPLTLTVPFALITYLFVAHTLDAPSQALGAALLAGGVTALVGNFCVGLVEDTVDTLYMCYCIDKSSGERRREEVFVIFEYDPRRALNPPSQSPPQAQHQHQHQQQQQPQAPIYQPQPQARASFIPHQAQQPQGRYGQEPEQIIPLSPTSPRQTRFGRQHTRGPSFASPKQVPLASSPLSLAGRLPDEDSGVLSSQQVNSGLSSQQQVNSGLSGGLTTTLSSQPLPASSEEEEVDPFLSAERDESEVGVERGLGRSGLGLGRSGMVRRDGEDEDEDSDSVNGEGAGESGYFPGSGFF